MNLQEQSDAECKEAKSDIQQMKALGCEDWQKLRRVVIVWKKNLADFPNIFSVVSGSFCGWFLSYPYVFGSRFRLNSIDFISYIEIIHLTPCLVLFVVCALVVKHRIGTSHISNCDIAWTIGRFDSWRTSFCWL